MILQEKVLAIRKRLRSFPALLKMNFYEPTKHFLTVKLFDDNVVCKSVQDKLKKLYVDLQIKKTRLVSVDLSFPV